MKHVLRLIFGGQLVPGHEVVGTVAKVGRNVTGFAEGDRCVADPGVTVNPFSAFSRRSSNLYSARNAFIVDEGNHCCARTLMDEGLQWLEDLLNTWYCECHL